MINIKYILCLKQCGYFCLKHILKKVNVVNKNYMSLYEISKILRLKDYSCVCVRIKNVEKLLFECITLIRINDVSYHYVVLKRKDKYFIYYYDPLYLYIRKMKIEKFVKKWCNICLYYKKI